LTTALLFQTDLSRSAVLARTRSTPPTSSKSGALIRHRFDPGFLPRAKNIPVPNAIVLAWVELID